MPDHSCLATSNLSVDAKLQYLFVSTLTLLLCGSLISVGTLVVNVLILAAVLITKTLQKPVTYLMCSLSMTHVIWSLGHLSFYTTARVEELNSKDYCFEKQRFRLFGFLVRFYLPITLGNLAMISLDRYNAVTRPFQYRANTTKARALKKIAALWVTLLVTQVANVLIFGTPTKGVPALVTLSAILMIVIIAAQLGVLRGSRWQQKIFPGQEAIIRAIELRSQKVSKEVRKMLLSLVLGFSPLPVTAVVKVVLGVDCAFLVTPWSVFILTFNSAVNTYIHLNSYKETRQAVTKIVKCRQGCTAVVPLQ